MPEEIMDEFADFALKIAKENDAVYSFIDLPNSYDVPIRCFLDHGYKEIANSLRMAYDLNGTNHFETPLRFQKVERDEVPKFLDCMREFMSGSHDIMADIIFSNLGEMPDIFLDHFYNTEQLFWVYLNGELVGILDLCPNGYANIANIGISPKHRGKKFGRHIMLHAMNLLCDMDLEKAGLRVHVDNKVALQLYDSLGFVEESSYRALIWRK